MKQFSKREDKIKFLSDLQKGKVSIEEYRNSLKDPKDLPVRVQITDRYTDIENPEYLYFLHGEPATKEEFEIETAMFPFESIITFS